MLSRFGEDAKILAGGQSLLPLMALRLSHPANLVDISRVPGLNEIVEDVEGGLAIGATVTHTRAEEAEAVHRLTPLVAAALPLVGHRAIRNRGTVVGSLAHADPAAELPAVALALGARFIAVKSGGQRRVAAADFFSGFLTTDLAPDELLLAVGFPPQKPRTGVSVKEISRRSGDFAIVGLAATVSLDEAGLIASSALSFFGAASTAVRVTEAEEALAGQSPGPEAFEEAARIVSQSLDPPEDANGTTAYRKHVAGVLTRNALADAIDQIGFAA